MAFIPKFLSGRAGGSALAPSVFTYTTPEALSAVTTAGYFNSLGGGLELNDLIYVVSRDDEIGGPALGDVIICTQAEYIDGAGFTTDFVDSKTFAGDARSEDMAGLRLSNFSGNIGAGSGASMYTYRNNTDTMALIATAGYFNEASFLMVNDTILVVSTDDYKFHRVSDITAGVITTVSIALVP